MRPVLHTGPPASFSPTSALSPNTVTFTISATPSAIGDSAWLLRQSDGPCSGSTSSSTGAVALTQTAATTYTVDLTDIVDVTYLVCWQQSGDANVHGIGTAGSDTFAVTGASCALSVSALH